MPVEIFTRSQFEKALSFFPLGFRFIGAKSGQLEYLAPIVTKLECSSCGHKFYPRLPFNQVECPNCGFVANTTEKVIFPSEIYIKICSSIDPITGQSRLTGRDSIRLVLLGHNKKPLGSVGYTTRVEGWEDRLRAKCRTLWEEALNLPRCPTCHHHVGWSRCRSGVNKDRWFAKCFGCDQWIGWKHENVDG